MDLPDDLIILIINNINNTKDIFNLRLTNKQFYKNLKTLPIYKKKKHVYDVTLKDNIIHWYNLKTKKKDKEIVFKPFGGITIINYNGYNNYDYKFNLPYNFTKIKKDKSFIRKYKYNIINNKYSAEVTPLKLNGCNIS